MKTPDITTTNISVEHKKVLKKMASAFNISQMQFINDCIYYFKISGTNPSNVEPFSPKIAIENLTQKMNQAIRFFQKHETEKLKPLLDELIITNQKLNKALDYMISKKDLDSINNNLSYLREIQENFHDNLNERKHLDKQEIGGIHESLSMSHKKILEKLDKNQSMIEILFEALNTKGISGIKPTVVEQFNHLKNT